MKTNVMMAGDGFAGGWCCGCARAASRDEDGGDARHLQEARPDAAQDGAPLSTQPCFDKALLLRDAQSPASCQSPCVPELDCHAPALAVSAW
eukprot:CAMPEP_0179975520 /NCGR_PEP_ID=MMETSP0983-20121128/38751_1 /TAXON_ID=483367 /ORGANISM="non described non described, Strain CCMP 2436" /LENGTH=91 /DNA_ID=CAMNT_0021892009 /DNA_START=554 /DNA_END=826 /DNA_ORIENTATION=+